MSRPPFRLDDSQARELIGRLQEVETRNPFDPRDHRPFVRDFLRAVYAATGQVYGAASYRRLLSAYAPERRPSTTTLEQEKDLLVAELKRERVSIAELALNTAPELAELVRLAVQNAIGQASSAEKIVGGREIPRDGDGAETAVWKERATELEKSNREANALVGAMQAELDAGRQTMVAMREELAWTKDVLAAQTTQLERLAATVEDARLLYLRAVDDARGETRAWRDRCVSAEAAAKEKTKEDQLLLETFRQMAYQRGGTIPPSLRKDAK